jgi:hypothetical protein
MVGDHLIWCFAGSMPYGLGSIAALFPRISSARGLPADAIDVGVIKS